MSTNHSHKFSVGQRVRFLDTEDIYGQYRGQAGVLVAVASLWMRLDDGREVDPHWSQIEPEPQPIPEEMRPGAWVPRVGALIRLRSCKVDCIPSSEAGAVGRLVTDEGTPDNPYWRAKFPSGNSWCVSVSNMEPADALADRLDSVIEAQREVNRPDPYADERTGRYGGSDLGHEEVVAELTAKLPANVEARKKLIAALAAEQTDLAKKFQPRFPAEGRSCRVYRSNRG